MTSLLSGAFQRGGEGVTSPSLVLTKRLAFSNDTHTVTKAQQHSRLRGNSGRFPSMCTRIHRLRCHITSVLLHSVVGGYWCYWIGHKYLMDNHIFHPHPCFPRLVFPSSSSSTQSNKEFIPSVLCLLPSLQEIHLQLQIQLKTRSGWDTFSVPLAVWEKS